MRRDIFTSLTLFVLLFLLTGLGYPLAVLYVGQYLFPAQANGGLIEDNGHVVGSALIGQNFTGAGYFHARPSAAGNGYDAANSSGSNSGPTDKAFLRTVAARAADLKANNGLPTIPVDMVTASGSGLDPDISPASAQIQVPRIAEARHLDRTKLNELITQYIESRSLGFLGENRVNVLQLNLALDRLSATAP